METRLAITISSAKSENLSKKQHRFLEAVQNRVERAGFCVSPDLPGSDRIEERLHAVQQCHGTIVLAFGQWQAQRLHRQEQKTVILPTEFTHMDALMAIAAKRPLLVLREKTVADRGVFRKGYVHPIVNLPNSLEEHWLNSPEFEFEFKKWEEQVNCFRHVFLGYSSQASNVAQMIQKFITERLGLRVFDWHDFRPGDTVWDSIDRAERLTSCGIFMFMADDKLTSSKGRQLAPRDNVVYEAGYFAGAKGRSRSLVILEEGAKVPTDLGGILYLSLVNRGDIAPLETKLREHLERMLSAS